MAEAPDVSPGRREPTAAVDLESLHDGTVLRAIGGIYDVQADEPVGPEQYPVFRCALRDRMRKQLIRTESHSRAQRVREVRRLGVVEPVVAGDRVRFRRMPWSGKGLPEGAIEELLPRTRELTRLAVTTGSVPVGQTLVANLDQVFLVFAVADPEPRPGLIDRFLVSCEAAQLPAILLLNKCDLGISEDLAHELEVYVRAGYKLLLTSARSGQGMDELHRLVHGRTSAFVGPSGVGKSTLLNTLEPGLGLRVGEISAATGKGVHTTRAAQLIPMRDGGFLADTPGLRQLGLWAVSKDELDQHFPEFRPYLGRCRFGNCAHVDDEGCAVRAAAERGEVDARRYESYVKLFLEG